jgi:3'(2'), 5'-bisphosphate nucleotidase
MEKVLNSADFPGGKEEPFWTLDPIDGTKGYIRGGQYAVALAYLEEGRPQYGVLGCPNLGGINGHDQSPAQGMIFSAGTNEPPQLCSLEEAATEEPRWSSVPTPPKSVSFSDARMCESFESGHADHELHQEICRQLGIAQSGVRMDSQCKYAALARGEAHIYLRLPSRPGYVEKIWDHAAGWVLVTEAGGTVTDAEGNPLDFSQGYRLENNRGVIASCGVDHAKLIEAVRTAMSSS